MPTLILLAVALAMDAVAVALVMGAAGPRRWDAAARVALAFGLAQGLMPLAGWALGAAFAPVIAPVDHWIAFVLLAILGGRMIRAGLAPADVAGPRTPLLAAALATSIDAAAAGLTLPVLGIAVPLACATIGLVTAALSAPAYWLGGRASARLGTRAEVAGGLVLIALGAGVLIEHLRG